jgi:hypothetical protein
MGGRANGLDKVQGARKKKIRSWRNDVQVHLHRICMNAKAVGRVGPTGLVLS